MDILKELEKQNIELSTEFCNIAKGLISKYETFKENITTALNEYENADAKNKKKALSKIEEIYIDNAIYLKGFVLPRTSFYLDNVAFSKYNKRIQRYNKKMYDTLHLFQREMYELRYNLEMVDKRIEKKLEKEELRREKIQAESGETKEELPEERFFV